MATTITLSALCVCGAAKSRSYPLCRSCYFAKKAQKALAEPIYYKRLTSRAEEGRKEQARIDAIFGEEQDAVEFQLWARTYRHWTYDHRGIEERAASNKHSGAIGEFALSHEFDHLPHSVGVRRSKFFEHTAARSSRPRTRSPLAQRRSVRTRGTTPSKSGYRGIIDRTSNDLSSEFDRYGIDFLVPPKSAWSDIRAWRLHQEKLAREHAAQKVEIYVDSDPAFRDGEPIVADRISGTLRTATRETEVVEAMALTLEYVDGVAIVSATIVETPVGLVVEHARAWPLPESSDESDAALEAELRRDYPQLFERTETIEVQLASHEEVGIDETQELRYGISQGFNFQPFPEMPAYIREWMEAPIAAD